jgi:hypothetical protein
MGVVAARLRLLLPSHTSALNVASSENGHWLALSRIRRSLPQLTLGGVAYECADAGRRAGLFRNSGLQLTLEPVTQIHGGSTKKRVKPFLRSPVSSA